MLVRNLLFTVFILFFSLLAFVFPQVFLQIGEFETKSLIIPLLMIIMFGMGTHISVRDFVSVWQRPKSLLLGLGLQFSVMPAVAVLLTYFSGLPAEVAAGVILVGCSPSGLASNVMCFIAKANLALSVSLTTFATLIAPFITPLLMTWLASEYVAIEPVTMFATMLKLVLLPITAGMLVNHFLPPAWQRIKDAMPLLSMFGIITIVAIIIANGQQALKTVGIVLMLVVIVHNLLGLLFGYLGGKLVRLTESECRALAFEVGMQNSGLASGIAVVMNKAATMGLAAALFSSLQNITGSVLAAHWSTAKPDQLASHR